MFFELKHTKYTDNILPALIYVYQTTMLLIYFKIMYQGTKKKNYFISL